MFQEPSSFLTGFNEAFWHDLRVLEGCQNMIRGWETSFRDLNQVFG